MGKTKVIIDTDPGTDDAMAILMVLKHQNNKLKNKDGEGIDVVAITVCHGNTNVQQASKNAARVLKVAGRLDIPIFIGASKSLLNLPKKETSHFHGLDGLGDTPGAEKLNYNQYLNRTEDAHHALLRLVNENQGEIVLLCLGPLTNVATAVRADLNFGSKLKDCIIMGGNYTGLGNITPTAEFNFYEDPEAAHIVLTQLGRMICLITLELCCNTTLSWEYYDELVGMDTDTSRFLKAIGGKMKQNASSVDYETFVWDQVAAAVLIDKNVVTSYENVCCQVELGGMQTRGQVVVDWRKSRSGEDLNVRLVKEIDKDVFKRMLQETVST